MYQLIRGGNNERDSQTSASYCKRPYSGRERKGLACRLQYFIQSDEAYYDVVPLTTRFQGISGVKDFYQVIAAAVPDFQVLVTGEYDTPGCLIREVTITGTHQGEYCGIPSSGNPVCVELAAFYLFGTGENVDKLVAERIYFDNEILLRQMRGEADVQTGIGLVKLAQAATSKGD